MASIFNFSPQTGSPGDNIIIIGIGFASSVQVRFGGVNAASFEVINDYQINAVVGAGASGDVQVFSGSDAPTLSGFTFQALAAPIISGFTPIAQVPGQKVSISGTNFKNVTSVRFGATEAIFFRVVSSSLIEAYPAVNGTDTVTVQNTIGEFTTDGFTLLLSQVKLVDLPVIGRDVQDNDKLYVWDWIRNILCQANASQFPGGSGSGGGSGGSGNIYTALGSPFKVRIGDDNFEYTENVDPTLPGSCKITDVRLLGKSDYVVSATDAGEFENVQLEFDEDEGSVVILNYSLTMGKHITIYADGVLNLAFQTFLINQTAEMDKLKKVAAPFLPSMDSGGVLRNPGGLVAWFRPAIEIPEGWAEWLPGRGYTLAGQNPSDTYNSITNPDGLSQNNGVAVGSLNIPALTADNIPQIQLKLFSGSLPPGSGSANNISAPGNADSPVSWSTNHLNGNQDYDLKKANTSAEPTLGVSSKFGKLVPDQVKRRRDPQRIVNFIYSTQGVS